MINNSSLDDSATKEALKNSSIVMVESLPSQSSGLSWMWRAPTIRLVLVARGTLLAPPTVGNYYVERYLILKWEELPMPWQDWNFFRDKGGEVEAALEFLPKTSQKRPAFRFGNGSRRPSLWSTLRVVGHRLCNWTSCQKCPARGGHEQWVA
jgi:hypothetical protein